MKKLFCFIAILIGLASFVQASYLKDVPVTLVQPSGDTLHCFATGDEYYNYLHDANGYTIVLDTETGYYVYALKESDQLIPSSYIAGTTDPATVGLVPFLNISAEQWKAKRNAFLDILPAKKTTRSAAPNGVMNNVVIFINFKDNSNFTTSFSTMEKYFNDSSSTASSLYDYYRHVSFNKLSVVSHFYPAPSDNKIEITYVDQYSKSYYEPQSSSNSNGYSNQTDLVMRRQNLLINAVKYVESNKLIPASLKIDNDNDGNIDNITFVVRGGATGWGALLWPHRSYIALDQVYINGKRAYDYIFILEQKEPNKLPSTLCHEMFHSFGAPDLYHYETENNTQLNPVGKWDLMENNQNPPQNMSAYMKYKYGKWITEIPEITTAGTYTLRPVASSSNENLLYKIATNDPRQFYILEYRNKNYRYDSSIPGSGLLIYMIDTRWDGNSNYKPSEGQYNGVYLFRPGGTSYNIQGQIDRANFSDKVGRTVFNDTTNPAPFLSDGTRSLLFIEDIKELEDSTIQFTYLTPRTLNVDTTEYHFDNKLGESFTFKLESNTQWSITNSGTWLNISERTGDTSKLITLTTAYNYNLSPETRYDTLIINGIAASQQRIIISQSGFEFSLSAEHVELAGNSEATLTITSNVEWNIVGSPKAWIESISPKSGIGTTGVTIKSKAFDASTYEKYYMAIQVAGLTKTVLIQNSESGIEDVTLNNSVAMFPNPTEDVLHLTIENTSLQINEVKIYDVFGKLIKQTTIGNDSQVVINVEDLSPGTYIIHALLSNNKTEHLKFIKL